MGRLLKDIKTPQEWIELQQSIRQNGATNLESVTTSNNFIPVAKNLVAKNLYVNSKKLKELTELQKKIINQKEVSNA